MAKATRRRFTVEYKRKIVREGEARKLDHRFSLRASLVLGLQLMAW
jgi:hypothetical protein